MTSICQPIVNLCFNPRCPFSTCHWIHPAHTALHTTQSDTWGPYHSCPSRKERNIGSNVVGTGGLTTVDGRLCVALTSPFQRSVPIIEQIPHSPYQKNQTQAIITHRKGRRIHNIHMPANSKSMPQSAVPVLDVSLDSSSLHRATHDTVRHMGTISQLSIEEGA